ncbi:Peptidyl-prolyl cis-trans isomerase FKBP17-1, chloroplastic [Dendrobium catenatum]|uniref:Peptidyl-prolyl cis-trans isomerase FKBP17-1, chloroplastic n=1 Tax=Dendrobium catenatum TaxID=906689 RepID=A0A2I0VFT6_9ASPA|nr:Peptidyl-prolyl cis-trans isomerase FKBP17-1, chloroplastic [Dendrobium catenatum]
MTARHDNLILSTLKQFSNSRRAALISSSIVLFQFSPLSTSFASITPSPSRPLAEFFDIPDAGGVKALDIRVGTGDSPGIGDKVNCLSLRFLYHSYSSSASALRRMFTS